MVKKSVVKTEEVKEVKEVKAPAKPTVEELMKKAIHAKCIACVGGYHDKVVSCSFKECPLYEYKD